MRRMLGFAAITVVLAVSGCVPEPVLPTLPPTPTAAPVFASEEEALAAAEDAYAAYVAMSDLIGSEAGEDAYRIEEVATGQLLDLATEGFDALRANAWRTVGATRVVAMTPQLVDLDAIVGEIGMITYVCVDVTGVDVLDSNGTSVVASDRPPLQAFEVGFEVVDDGVVPATREPWGDLQPCA